MSLARTSERGKFVRQKFCSPLTIQIRCLLVDRARDRSHTQLLHYFDRRPMWVPLSCQEVPVNVTWELRPLLRYVGMRVPYLLK